MRLVFFISMLFVFSSFTTGETESAERKLWQLTPREFFSNGVANQTINLNNPNDYLLSIAVFQATNELRQQNRLPKFVPNRELHLAGALHIDEMRRKGFFDHVNPYNKAQKTLGQRIKYQGGQFNYMAENLALLPSFNSRNDTYRYRKVDRRYRFFELNGSKLPVHTYESFAKEVVYEWYKSKGHRQNLLNSELTHIGIAVYIEPYNYDSHILPDVYAVQEFGGYQ